MIKHCIEIPSPLIVKPVLLQKIREANVPKKCVVDELALDGYSVLRVLPSTVYSTQSQPAFTCSKLTIETLEQGVKYVLS